MAILDLYEGNIEFIKNGACTTYIKNKNNITKVKINNLPIGMLENTEVSTYILRLPARKGLIFLVVRKVVSAKTTKREWYIHRLIKLILINN